MDIQYEKTGPVTAKLSITIDANQVDQAFSRVYKDIAKQVRIPGFRPGKAPRHVLDMRYGQQVRSDVEQALIEGTLFRALQEKEVKAVATSHIHRETPKRGKEWSYTAEVETQPEVKVETFKGLYAPILKVEVEDEAIDEEIEKMRQQMMQLVPITDRDEVQEGDLIIIDHEATENGEPLPGGKAQGAIVEVGAKDGYIPGLGDKLLGHKVPSEAEVEISFDEDYDLASWRGRTAQFKVSLKELKKRDLPAVDDEFAQDVGEDNLKALRQKIHDRIFSENEKDAKKDQREALLESLVDANEFDVPPSMIRDQAERMVQDAIDQVRQMMGPGFNPQGLDLNGLRERNMERAEYQVRSGLLLVALTEQEKMEVSDAEIDAEIERISEESGAMAAQVKQHFSSPQARSSLRFRLLEDKAVDMLLEHAKLSDKAPERKPKKAKPAAKPAPAKAEAKAEAPKKAKSEEKTPAKKEAPKKAAKPAAKETKEKSEEKVEKKATAKKATAKKATAKKATAKKATAKKATAKKATAKKATAKKATAKKATAKKATAKKATAKKATAKKATAKKATAKKATAKKATAKKKATKKK